MKQEEKGVRDGDSNRAMRGRRREGRLNSESNENPTDKESL